MNNPKTKNTEQQFQEIKTIIKHDSKDVDSLIRKNLHSDVSLIAKVSEYIINSGGKRIRPLIVLLVARALDYNKDKHIASAAIIEFIHTATLLHDDVVDNSKRRRGQDTANIIFGNQASVLIGDFLYSRAFQMMVELNDMEIMEVLANATNTIATGEVMQLINIHDPEVTEENYFQVIYRKTSCLFEAGCHVAAIIAASDENERTSLIDYGKNLGMAFQIIDDTLDFGAPENKLGKNLGDDLAEGKPTLPIIYAIDNSSAKEKELLQSAIKEGDLTKLEEIQNIIRSTGAIEYATSRAIEFSGNAIASISHLPSSKYKEALISIANFSVDRES
ncbi:MAG: polyprenyl synthetase family protein [Pseudomonadota bacterium]|nr:polyprenyl synthetase family protein [Pseudomonadota bacterium]